jgi:hypothetical protein
MRKFEATGNIFLSLSFVVQGQMMDWTVKNMLIFGERIGGSWEDLPFQRSC